VPILKKPKLQKIIENKFAATDAADRYDKLPRLPIKPVSMIPTKGIAKFAKKIGMDNFKIYFIEAFCI
jgi:hypothetical protein